jgi:hypothetical protein
MTDSINNDQDFAERYGITADDFRKLQAAAETFWNAMEGLGWVDGYGGAEFERVFPRVLEFIHAEGQSSPAFASEDIEGAFSKDLQPWTRF